MKQAEDSTVIGKSVSIRGELSGSEDLYLDGEIQGTVSLPGNRLTIGPNARVLADVHVRDVIVFGRLEGNIHASGRVELRQSAVMQGDITASRLVDRRECVGQGKNRNHRCRSTRPVLPGTRPCAGLRFPKRHRRHRCSANK